MKWRITVLSFVLLLFSLLALGEIKEFGNDINYPAQAGVNLTRYEGNLPKEQIYAQLDELSKENNLVLFKPILQEKGQEKVYVFGEAAPYLKNKNYSADKNLLSDTTITGMYYSSKSISKNLKNKLEVLGFQYKAGDIGWWLTPIDFFVGNIRSLAVWTLLFVFAVLLFAVKMMYVKKAMIQRSLGIFRKAMWKATFSDVGIILIELFLVIGLFSLWQRSIDSVFVKSFALLMSVIALSLLWVSLVANGLFALNIRLTAPLKVLKNKKSQGLISYVWLFGILISVFIFGITASKMTQVSQELTKQIGVLEKWAVASNFARITWFSAEEEYTDENHQIDAGSMKRQAQKNKEFVLSFKEEEMIYSQKSDLGDSHVLENPRFKEDLDKAGVDIKVAQNIFYVNQGMVEKNKQLYPKNQYGNGNNALPVTIYIPEKFLSSTDKIKNILMFEWFQHSSVSSEQFEIVPIPDGQVTFLFRDVEGETELLAEQMKKDAILVQLNFENFPSDDETLNLDYSNISFDSLFNQTKIPQNIKNAELESTFSSLTNASQDVLLKRNKVKSQLTGTIIALVALVFAQLFVLYQYIILQIKNRAKQLAIKSFFGKPVAVEIMKMLAFLIVGIFFASGFAYAETKNIFAIFIVCLMYLIEIVALVFLALWRVKEKRVQILKGDFEFL
ncbi:MAG: ABC transporter permease [Lactobacillales bacterium]|jgi:hypothetical protein|nr:ABC transporter permease [Lactobacillales bacterium]